MEATYRTYGIEIDGQDSGEIRTICPECSPKRRPEHRYEKDLTVNIDKGVWFCQHCGWRGSLLEEKTETVIFKPIPSIAKPSINKESKLYSFFQKRGISPEVVDRNGIGQATVYVGAAQGKQWCIVYPMTIGAEVYNEKYRAEVYNEKSKKTEKCFQHPKGATLIMYKLNDIMFEDECIITEGFEDALAFEEAGFKNAISVPNGAPQPGNEGKDLALKYIDNSYPYLKHIKKFYLAVDNDEPGRRLKEELARRLGKSKCYVIQYPEDCKDANEILQKHGASGIQKCLSWAVPWPVEGVFEISVVDIEIEKIFQQGLPKGVSCGLTSELDDKYKLFPGMLTVVTGIPNHGKSPFVDNICVNVAKNVGWKTAFFTPEHGFITLHAIRLIRQYVGEQFLPYYSTKMSERVMKEAKEFLNEHIKYIYPRDENFTLENILDGVSYTVAKWGVKNVVLDPWNAIEHQMKPGENETNYICRVLNKIKYFARDHDVHFFMVAHPTKMRKQKDSNHYEVPTLYDISGSAHWRNVPDGGLVIYRQMDESQMVDKYTKIFIQKVKWEFMGHLGQVTFNFDAPSQRFIKRM